MTVTDTPAAKPFSPEELEAMPDGERFELVDGHLVERKMGNESSAVASRILGLLFVFLRGRRLGTLLTSDAGYQCFADDPDRVRKPDVSFIRAGRLPDDRVAKGFDRIAPDLAVEVISPHDTADEVEEKVHEYLGAGVPLVWVVYPNMRTVRVHRPRAAPAGPISNLSGDDVISGEAVLPGFTCPVREFFEDAPTSS